MRFPKPGTSAQGVTQRKTRKHERTRPVVVEKGAEAVFPFALSYQPLLPDERDGAKRETVIIRSTELRLAANEEEIEENGELQQADYEPVLLAEEDGRGFHADFQIVVAIDHRVLRVVRRRPQHVRNEHQPRDRRHFAELRGEGRRDGPAEGST